jgi:pyruvate ferredoxin oxidoreductase beta subunit
MASTNFPYTSWRINWIHSAFENASATISGVESMYMSLRKQGKLPPGENEMKFLAIGGDGATYDIGFASLSGAIERGHNFVYLCYDNQLYANTGGQRSSASPMGVATTTTPVSETIPGKLQLRKDITKIISTFKTPYVAQTAPWLWQDLYRKAQLAFDIDGPAFLNVLSPCPDKWKTPTHKSIELSRLATDTCIWPVYEVKNGTTLTVNYKPRMKLPVTEWFSYQPRYKHLLLSENRWIVDKIQEEVDKDWEYLLTSETNKRDN